MKPLLTALAFVVSGAFAAEPSDAVVRTCLGAEAVSSKVSYRTLPNQEVLSQEGYKPGYNASYYVDIGGKDIGYAEGQNRQAIIYSGTLYPLESAIAIKGHDSQHAAVQFNPYLAEWGRIREHKNRYLCVSFNFDGLGRSGSYQNVRGGYLLDVGTRNRRLYFGVALLHEPSGRPLERPRTQ